MPYPNGGYVGKWTVIGGAVVIVLGVVLVLWAVWELVASRLGLGTSLS